MNNTSELCVRCGLCCVVLQAACTEEEARALCADMNVSYGSFIEAEPRWKPPQDRVAIRFPCTFLRGRPGKGVLCTAYGRARPKLCSDYLCRIATAYKIGEVTLAEGVASIQRGFWGNDPGAFNWTGGDQERRLLVREMVEVAREQMEERGDSEFAVDLAIANKLTTRFFAKSDADGALLNMHFAAHDRRMAALAGNLDPQLLLTGLRLYLDDDFLKGIDIDHLRSMGISMCAVLTELRSFLSTEAEAEAWMENRRKELEHEQEQEQEDHEAGGVRGLNAGPEGERGTD